MKQVLVILAVIISTSCGQSKPVFTTKSDTVDVVVRTSLNGPTYLLKGVYSTVKTFVPVDSNSLQGKLLQDTVWQVKVLMDTARDKDHKPLFDSAHHPIPNYQWQVADKRFVEIINVPRVK